MTKQELMENFTKEGLADEILAIEKICENENIKLKYIEQLENKNKELLDTLCHGDWPEKLMEHNKEFAGKIEELQSEVKKYRKDFEDAKNERDCKIAEYQKKIEELIEENNKLKGDVDGMNYQEKQDKTNNFYGIYAHSAKNLTKDDLLMFLGILTKELTKNGIDFRYEMEKELKVWDIKIESDKEITDFLPTEPIKVADMLINAEGEYEHNPIEKALCGEDKGIYRIFNVSELRQIAEHLLVYCNHNGEVEE